MDQEKLYFGRTMDPCDYKAPTAKSLGENGCVVISAYDGKIKTKNKKSDKNAERDLRG